jgi:peptidoglycan/xylan/chitin deacetylase (PgdA/CDA1 family)
MLLILLYHRAVDCQYGNAVATLRAHFGYLSRRFPTALPGEALRPGRLNICLTFDDATADFFGCVFPLLREFSLRAVLAVPTGFIVEKTSLSLEERMGVPGDQAMAGELFRTKAPFCTWEELKLMAASGLVEVASHSHQHIDLTRPESDARSEAVRSKTMLEQRLGRPVSTFVFPFGKVDSQTYGIIRQHYQYAMRIGGALNAGWSPKRQPLCRVGADRVPDIGSLTRWPSLARYGLKWAANGVRATTGKWDAR